MWRSSSSLLPSASVPIALLLLAIANPLLRLHRPMPISVADAFTPSVGAPSAVSSANIAPSSPSSSSALSAASSEQQSSFISSPTSSSSRRSFLNTAITTSAAAIATTMATSTLYPAPANAATSTSEAALVSDLSQAYAALQTIPALLQNQEWDKVRTILKTPPLVQLWNLGDGKNTMVQLAKETGDMELLEAKDELSISLQMCDQYTYDNVFVYFQPGNGKVKIKEPVDMATKAISQLKDVLDFVEKRD